jgi:hypothetical protein
MIRESEKSFFSDVLMFTSPILVMREKKFFGKLGLRNAVSHNEIEVK